MDPFERDELIRRERAAFRERLPPPANAPPVIRLATARIHQQLFDPALTVKRLRADLHLGSAAFSARFRRHHGRTPKRYLNHLRVRVAQRLMRPPALPIVDIAFDLPERAQVRLSAYDLLGREVAVLVDEARSAGTHRARLEGAGLASGVYVVRLAAEGRTRRYTQSERVVLVK